MSEKQQTTAQPTTTKDYTPARLKIEKEYNDKRTGSGWQRHYKVIILHPLYVVRTYIQEKLSYSGQKQRVSTHQAGKRTHSCVKTHTHTQTEIQTHRHFYSFLIRFPRKCDECAKGFCRCRCHQHTYTHTQQQPQHIHMNLHGYICVCVCVAV